MSTERMDARPAMAEHARAVYAAARSLYSAAEVNDAVAAMARAIRADLEARDPLLLCVMVGGLVPTGLLLPHLAFPFRLDYLQATRYRGTTRGGGLEWRARPRTPLAGEHVLIVDDILDEGVTLAAVCEWCREQGAASVRTAVLVEKQHARNQTGLCADYVGLDVPDVYVFGSGMDYHEYLRNAPGVFAVADGDAS